MTLDHVLYRLSFPSGKKYYGITKHYAQRMREHALDSRAPSYAVHFAIRKYGWENVTKEILCEGSRNIVCQLEISAIATDNTRLPNGYNGTPGGDGGGVPASVGGKKSYALRLGAHAPGVNSAAGKKSKTMKVGVHAASREQLSAWAKTGCVKGGKTAGPKVAKLLNAKRWRCECGFASNLGNITTHKRKSGHASHTEIFIGNSSRI